ncbi:Transporter of the ATP-binding cassette (ABC), partial [Coemansia helicoidea]
AVVLVDNRMRTGAAVVAAAAVQAALAAAWWRSTQGPSDYPLLLAQTATLAAATAAACVAAHAHDKNRLARRGLFPGALAALAAAQLAAGLCEMHASFFGPDTAAEPICGPHASARSNFLTASTVVSAGAFLLHATIQPRAVFQRPDAGAAPPPEPCDGDPTEQDGATPLARHADLPAAQLADTPEPAASWAGRVTFSWINFLMRRGARQQLDAGDLYALHRTELPVASWERFQRCRRPGRTLVVTLALTFAPEFLLQAAYSVMASLLSFAGPFFLQRIIRAIEQADGSDANLRTAYLDAFGLLLFTLGQTLAESQKLWVGRIISIRLKGLLVAELSAKTLRRRGKGTWEDDKDAGRDGEGDADGGSGEPAAEAAVD